MIQRLLSKDYFVFIIFFIVAIFFLHELFFVGFLNEDYMTLERFTNSGFEALNNNFNDKFFLPLSHFIQFLEFKLFGINTGASMAFHLLLHTLNAWLLYLLLKRIFQPKDAQNKAILLSVGLLFLVAPYQLETIAWHSACSYLYATSFILWSSLLLAKYVQHRKTWQLLASASLFFCSLLCKEIAVFYPIIVALVLRKSIRKHLAIIWSLAGLMVLYFVLRYMALGSFIGGYGAEVHLGDSWSTPFYGLLCYFLKFSLFYRYTVGVLRDFGWSSIWSILTIGLASLALLWYLMRWKLPRFTALTIGGVIIILAVLPVATLETSFLGDSQGDRYGYLIWAVILGVGSTLLIETESGKRALLVLPILVLLFGSISHKDSWNWRVATEISEEFLEEVHRISKNEEEFRIINVPDNFNGAYLFRNGLKNRYRLTYPEEEIKFELFAFSKISNRANEVEINGNKVELKQAQIYDHSKKNGHLIIASNTFTFPNGFFDEKPTYVFAGSALIRCGG